MFNKKILASAISIVTALSMMGAATFAYFSDTGTNNDNVFSTGTLDMELSNDNSTFTEDVTATFGLADGAPGDTFNDTLFIKNTGSVDANHIELTTINNVTESEVAPGNSNSIFLDTVIEITALDWDSDGNGSTETSVLSQVTDANLNGYPDLDDLSVSGLDNLTFGGTQNIGHGLRIAGRFNPDDTVDQHQGDNVDVDLTLTMNQDSSQ